MLILLEISTALYLIVAFSRNQLYHNGIYLISLIALFANFYIQSNLTKNKKSE